jgi:hypothetical protein
LILGSVVLLASTLAAAGAGEGTPAVMWVIVPKNVAPRVQSSAVLDAARAAFVPKTRLQLGSPEEGGVELARLDACDPAARYGCWLSVVKSAAPSARYFFALAVQPGAAADSFSLVVLDLERSAARTARIPENTPDRAELVESELFAGALRSPPVQVDSMSRTALEKYFSGLLNGELGAMLAKNRDDQPLGKILVSAGPKNWPIALDGENIAVTSSKAVLIEEVAPGRREIALLLPDGDKVAQVVNVEAGRTSTVGFGLEPGLVQSRENTSLKYGMIFSGVAAFSIGAVVLASGASRAGNIRQSCLLRAGDAECRDAGTVTFGHQAEEIPSLSPDAVNPRGILMAPLAIGMIGAGVLLAGGALWLDDLERRWWWPVVAGLGFTAASYGLGLVLDPR